MKVDLKEVARLIIKWDNILILTHRSPDGDTLGSAYALKSALDKLGKKVYVLNDGEVAKKYAFILQGSTIMPNDFNPDFVISVDTAEASLLGSNFDKYGDKVDLCIDHHISNSDYAKYTYVDPIASATGEIIYDLILMLKVPLNTNIARDLYVSIVSDTGCFKFSNTTSKTLITASELIKFDFEFTPLLRNLFDLRTKGQIQLEKLILENMEHFNDGKITVICITSEMMQKTETTNDDLEGFAQLPRYIEGTLVGITIKQFKDKKWRISLRSSGIFDASKACQIFGGGGHLRAAGCEIEGSIDEVKEKILTTVRSFMEPVVL